MPHKRTVNGSFSRHETPWGCMKDVASQFHVYIRDYQGKILTGMPHGDATGASANRHKFGGKEYLTESGLNELDFGARHMLPQYGMFTSPDPKAADCRHLSPWAYCAGDPVNNTDPTGMSVIYTVNGDYIGHSSEGFNGEVLIYTGTANIDFSKLTHSEALEKYPFDLLPFDTMRGQSTETLSGEAMSKIWTHIVSHFEGMQVYDEVFSMSSLPGNAIGFDHKGIYSGPKDDDNENNQRGSWVSLIGKKDNNFGGIVGTGLYKYETTVENVASSVIVHEWYSHGKKGVSDELKSHRLAYKNVINFKKLWTGTTTTYKSFVLGSLLQYTKSETGRTWVDRPYMRLFNK